MCAIKNEARVPIAIAILALITATVSAADIWPTLRGDTHRSSIVAETLQTPLACAWSYQPAKPPLPAWPEPAITNYAVKDMHFPLKQTLSFDRAFHVVANSQLVYFGSSADDTVRALDAKNGKLVWQFATEAPIRLTPVLHLGRLYVASDDGHLYALDAFTGKIVWKYFAGKSSARLPGNGRMISLWPLRSGPIVMGEHVYFTAGLFADHGVFLCALDLATGKEHYKTALNFTVQGMMLATDKQLFLPTGRTSYHSCDIHSGKPQTTYGMSRPWSKDLVGGCFALIHDGLLATGPSEDGKMHWFDFAAKNPIFHANADHFIVDNETVYLLGEGKLRAYTKSHYLANPRRNEPAKPLWQADAGSSLTMLLAGDRLVATGNNILVVHDKTSGQRLWQTTFDGKAEGLAYCARRLFLSLDNGKTLCYVPDLKEPMVVNVETTQPVAFDENRLLADYADGSLRAVGVDKGYCLIMQAESGQLAWEVLKRSQMRVVCREEDAAKAAKIRATFAQAGLYGERLEVHCGPYDDLPYPPNFANLILSEAALTHGLSLPDAAALARVMRPCGGTLCVAAAPQTYAARELSRWGAALPAWHYQPGKIAFGLSRRGALPGSGEWTHFYADPSNTACGNDEIQAGPMELQWFGKPGPGRMVDRHHKGPPPLYVSGRLFVPGINYMTALDAYNGVILWEREIPQSLRVAAFKDCSGMAVTPQELFIASNDKCLVLDAQSGATKRTINAIGGQSGQAWGYLAVVGDKLFGSLTTTNGPIRTMGKAIAVIIWGHEQPLVCSSALFAANQSDGEEVWHYRAQAGAIANPSITIGNGRIYFVESTNPETLQSADYRINLPQLVGKGATLVALDLNSGQPLWRQQIDLQLAKHILYMSYADETLLVTSTRYVEVTAAETKGRGKPEQLKRVRYDLYGFDAHTGNLKWQTCEVPNYDQNIDGGHGEQIQHPALANGIIYGPDFAVHLQDGKPYEGWRWKKSHKCAPLSMSRNCAFSRYTNEKLPYIFDLQSGENRPLSVATRPGCWINTIPAGGMVLIPEASAGCTCPYPIQTSLALRPSN